LSVLKKVFDKPSSPYSNREVKQMYMAAKHADQAGDRELTKRLLLELKKATPNDARVYRRLARMEKEDGNIAAARAVLEEGLELHPNNAFLWHGLGQLEGYAGNSVAQKQHLRKAIEIDPSLPQSYHALGTLEHTQGRVANAMKTLKKGIEYCPTNHRLHHALGDLYRDAKMLDMAISCYRKALKHGPSTSHGFAYTALAYAAYEHRQVDQCRRWLHKAVQVNNGRNANGWVALAQFEESEGNIDAARSACIASIVKYERGLLERHRNIKFRQSKSDMHAFLEDPVALKTKFLRSVPSYRSGDRFFNVYRNWARLEERYGTIDSVEEVYERASVAFPREWKLALDWAQYYVTLDIRGRARLQFADACSKAGNRHADPYRRFAEFEMSRGNFAEARKILYSGAMALSQGSESSESMGSERGLAELFHSWAVCEWHLDNLSHADILFRHALDLASSGEEESKLRSFVLYSMARLEYFRGEHRRAQHYIGLCLKENLMPGGNSKVWDLWAAIAHEMGNDRLAHQCQEQATNARLQEAENDGDPSGLSRLLAVAGSSLHRNGPDMQQLMRRDPWHHKIFGTSGSQVSHRFGGVHLPSENKVAHSRSP
jgi:tetratricopeptide (TPR) repeat protein